MRWFWKKQPDKSVHVPNEQLNHNEIIEFGNESEPSANFDPTSATWQYIVKYAQERVKQHHRDNSHQSITERRADVLRGRIAELEDLLKLPENKGL